MLSMRPRIPRPRTHTQGSVTRRDRETRPHLITSFGDRNRRSPHFSGRLRGDLESRQPLSGLCERYQQLSRLEGDGLRGAQQQLGLRR